MENTNIARMIAVQVGSTLKAASVALGDVVERAAHDGAGDDALARLHSHLVAISTTSPELHGLFHYGPDGSWLANALATPVKGNNADREYFTYHRNNPGPGLHVGTPIPSRTTGVWIIPV